MLESKHQGTHITPFSPMCISVMDLFLQKDAYFTPTTAALTMKESVNSIKACMNLLKRSGYLSKVDETGSSYFVSELNLECWVQDFKKHFIALKEKRDAELEEVKDGLD